MSEPVNHGNIAQPGDIFFGRGQLVNCYTFTAEQMTAENMARSLSRINRFTGNGEAVLSVAQHTVTLSYLVPAHLRRAALIHDCSEIFWGDTPSPMKKLVPELERAEERTIRRFAEVFNVPWSEFLELKVFDSAISRDEARSIFPEPAFEITGGFEVHIEPMTAEEAAEEWVARFYEVFA